MDQATGRKVRPFAITHRMVAMLAIPMTLAYMTTPLLGLVDTSVAGRLNDPAQLGGLAVGAVIIDVIFATFNFLRSGTTGMTAQAVGAEDEKEKQAVLARALLIAAITGAALIVLMVPILTLALWLMAPGADVAEATRSYFYIRTAGAMFALANYALLGWLIGLGRAGLGLALQIIVNGTNMVLSIALGLWLGYGLAGIALGTVIGELLGTIAGLLICRRLIDTSTTPSRNRIFDRDSMLRFANLNGDIMIRSFVLLGAFGYFTAQGANMGETVLAANAVLMNFFFISGYFLDGMATAAEQLVGRAIGANYREGFWRGIKLTLVWNALIAAALFAVLYLAGPWLVNTITTMPEVRALAQAYLVPAALTALTGVLAFQMDGVFIGAVWSREMSLMMVLSFIIYIAAWQLLQGYGNTGLWMALHIFLVARGFALLARLPIKARQTFGY